MIITHGRVNHVENPLGYLMDKITFTWEVQEAKGVRAAAACLCISPNADMTDPLYDTGFREDIDRIGHTVDLALAPRTRYYWTVSVRTDLGEEATSERYWFETAKQDEPWAAQWISCEAGEPRHPIFLKAIALSGPVAKARLYISGLGVYEAFLGAERIGNEWLTPYCNNYNGWVQYQSYDVTEALTRSNELSVALGNGWYNGRFGFDPDRPVYYGSECKLIAELRVDYIDGTSETIGTDEAWIIKRGPVTFSNIYDGECVDLTLPDTTPVAAVRCKAPAGALTARLSTPVTVHEEIAPIELIRTPKGELVLDVGQNLAGSFRLSVDVPKGQEVYLQFGEVMQHDCFYRDNLRSAKAEYRWISDGKPHVIVPHFTFYGYRFVKVEGIPDLKLSDFTALALYSDIPAIGSIETGHALVNKLVENTKWGQKGNFLDVPTDCPQRDERMGWTGDAQVFAPTASFLTDSYAFYKKYLYDIATEQAESEGMVPHVIPSFGLKLCACAWGDAATIIPWTIYEFYGDESVLRDSFDSMKAWVDYLERLDGDDHKWSKRFHFGDWLALDNPAGGDDQIMGGTDVGFLADVHFLYSARLTAKAARVLDKSEDTQRYEALAEKLLGWIRTEYFSISGRCCIDTQTAHLVTLFHDLSTDRPRAEKALVNSLERVGVKLKTGFVGTPILCRVLSDIGRSDLAYTLLLNEDYPGWLNEIKLGATTVWERWNSIGADGLISSTGMNSLNHYAYGSIVEWIWRYAVGFNPSAPGFREVTLKPSPHKDLKQLKAEYRSAAGLWQLSWSLTEEHWLEMDITVPFGCQAVLTLPLCDEPEQALTPGHYHFAYQGKKEEPKAKPDWKSIVGLE